MTMSSARSLSFLIRVRFGPRLGWVGGWVGGREGVTTYGLLKQGIAGSIRAVTWAVVSEVTQALGPIFPRVWKMHSGHQKPGGRVVLNRPGSACIRYPQRWYGPHGLWTRMKNSLRNQQE